MVLGGKLKRERGKSIENFHRLSPIDLAEHVVTKCSTPSHEIIHQNSDDNSSIVAIRERVVRTRATHMAPRDGSQERINTPDAVEKGIATVSTLRYFF